MFYYLVVGNCISCFEDSWHAYCQLETNTIDDKCSNMVSTISVRIVKFCDDSWKMDYHDYPKVKDEHHLQTLLFSLGLFGNRDSFKIAGFGEEKVFLPHWSSHNHKNQQTN